MDEMKTVSRLPTLSRMARRARAVFFALSAVSAFLFSLTRSLSARTYNTISSIDNTLTLGGSGGWDTFDEVVSTCTNSTDWGATNVLSNLYVTWDATNLYIGINGKSDTGNGLIIYVDRDYGVSDGANSQADLTDNSAGADNTISYCFGGLSDWTNTDFNPDFAICWNDGDTDANKLRMWNPKGGTWSAGATNNFGWYNPTSIAANSTSGNFEVVLPWADIYGTDSRVSKKIALLVCIGNDGARSNQFLPQNASANPLTNFAVFDVFNDAGQAKNFWDVVRNKAGRNSVVISEVMYNDSETTDIDDWLEITTVANSTISLNGWCVRAWDEPMTTVRNMTLPDVSISSGNYIVIHPKPGATRTDVWDIRHIYLGTAQDWFGADSGTAELYSSNTVWTSTTIVDFVVWDHDGTLATVDVDSHAVTANIWNNATFVDYTGGTNRSIERVRASSETYGNPSAITCWGEEGPTGWSEGIEGRGDDSPTAAEFSATFIKDSDFSTDLTGVVGGSTVYVLATLTAARDASFRNAIPMRATSTVDTTGIFFTAYEDGLNSANFKGIFYTVLTSPSTSAMDALYVNVGDTVWVGPVINTGKGDSATVTGNSQPNPPSTLAQFTSFGGAWAVGDWKSYQQICATFTLTDPDAANQVRFNIQFSTYPNFSYNFISATSAFMAQGATNYLTPLLPDGTWYWRVRCGDNSAASNDWNYTYSSMTVVNGIHFGLDVSSPVMSAPTVTRSHIMGIGADLSWSVAVDSYSGVANYKIYRATYSFASTSAANVTLAATLVNATTHQDSSGLSANTTYFYAMTAADNAGNTSLKTANAEIRTARVSIDGNASDWATATEAPWVDESTTTLVSTGGKTPYYEWSWRDKAWERRTDSSQNSSNFDLRFFRVTADEEYVYFYTKSDNLVDKDYYHFAVAIDTGGTTGLNWIGDDSNSNTNGGAAMGLGDEYVAAMKAAALVDFRYISSAGTDFRIHLYKNGGSGWDNPGLTGAGNTACWLTTGADGWMEAKVRRSDIDAAGTKTLKFAAAVFENQVGLVGGVDSTKYYAPDALDSMSIARISGASTYNDSQWGMNSWDEDISDADIDFWAQVQIDASGLKINRQPAAPSLSLPADGAGVNTHTPTFSWAAASDPDSGDAVTSYMIEISASGDFSSLVHWRVNVTGASWTVPQGFLDQGLYYWRVKSRDRSGAMSAPSATRSFTVDTSPPTVKYNTPSVAGSTVPAAGSASGVGGNYYVSVAGATVDIDFLNLSIGTKTITVDASASDWTGAAHSTIHGVAIRDGEWIYTGSKGDARGDLGADTPNGDLTEMRVSCDNDYVYILIKSSDITDIDKVHYAVGFDTDGDYTNGYSWIGDDSVSAGNSVPLARGYTYIDKIYLLRCAVTQTPTIEAWSGATWQAPSAGYSIAMSAANDAVEARIPLADLGIGSLPKTVRVIAASFINTLGWANVGDTTADIAGTGAGAYDVIDGLGGDFGVQTNYWGREIGTNDFDIGRYYDIRLGGEKANISTIDYRVNGGSWQNLATNISADYTAYWNPFSYATDSSTGCVVDFRAYDAGGNSVTQLWAFHYWKGGPPDKITNLSALVGNLPGEIRLSWTAPGDDGYSGNIAAGKYRIKWATTTVSDWDSGTWTDYANKYSLEFSTDAVVSATHGRTVTGLTEGVTYYFRVWTRDENEYNWSPISLPGATTWARVDDVAPAAITNLAASCASDGTGIVTLTWTAPREDGATAGGAVSSYEVRYATWDFTATWSLGTQWTIGVPSPSSPGVTQTLRLISLANNTTYYFHVKSTDDKSNVSPLDVGTTAQSYVQHIVISEVQTAGVNAGDEFIELYNPLSASINLSGVITRIFIRGGTGTGEQAPITWVNPTIPAYGYALIVATGSTANAYKGSVPHDATYSYSSIQLPDNGAVFIASQTATTPVWTQPSSPWGYVAIDLVGLGNQPSSGCETQTSTSPAANRSVERRALSAADPTSSPGIIQGNACDTNDNSADFVYTAASDPQNTLSSREPDSSPPSAISDLTGLAGSVNDGDVRLAWTAPYEDWNLPYTQNRLGYPTAAFYSIKYATTNITDFDNPPSSSFQMFVATSNVTPGSAVGTTITGLSPGTTYYFAIKTLDESGNLSSWSASGVNTANRNFAYDTNPTAPAASISGNVSSHTLTISWANNPPTYVDDLDKVKIYYATYSFTSETNPNTTYYGVFAKTDTPKTITGLLDWTTYFIRLKSVDYGDQGGGLWSYALESALSTAVSTRTLDGTPPSVVNNLSALTGAINGHIWLSWTAPSDNRGVSYYDIRYRTGGAVDDGNWAAASQIYNEPTPAAAGTQEWLLVTGLVQDVTYYFKMKSVDAAGNIPALSNSAYTYAQSSGAVLINEIAPSASPNFAEFLVVKPGCFRAMNFYGRVGGDLTSISTFSTTGAWSNTLPPGTFIVLNMTAGVDETAITGGVINMYKSASLTATDNNFILSGPLGVDYTGGVYVSGNAIDYMIFENQDTTRDAKVTSTMKSMISQGQWSSILDTASYDPLAFDGTTARNLSSSPGSSAARNIPTDDTNSKADWSYQSVSKGAANSASTAYAGYGVCVAAPLVALPDEIFTATFTYSGTTGAGSFANDDLRHNFTIDIPSGWTPPQTIDPAGLGFTTNTFSLTAGYSVAIATLSSGNWRIIVPLGDASSGVSYAVTYYGKASSTEQTYTFTTKSDYKGVNVADIGASSQPFVIVDGTPPGTITNLSALLTGDLEIKIMWTAPGNNNYSGELDTGSKFHIATTTVLSDAANPAFWSTTKRDNAEIKISTSGIFPAMSLSTGPYKLSDDTTYYMRIWTKDRAGNWSAVSNGATVYCKATPPDAIANLSATSTNVGTIDLTWNATGDDGAIYDISGGRYAIQRSSWTGVTWSTGNAQISFSTNVTAGAQQAYRDYGLQLGVTYYYRVWLRDENLTGWSSLSNGATTIASRTVSDGGAFVVYYDTSVYQTPVYRGWMSDYFSSEYALDNSAAAAPGLSGNYASAASPTKNEGVFLLGGKRTATYSGLWAYVHTGSTWTYSNLTPVPAYTDTTVGTVRRFDVAYEQKSGRAIAVYRNENFSTSRPVYRTFSGGAWSSETDTGLVFASAVHWIKLYPKPQTDEIMLVALLNDASVAAAVWDGTAWSAGISIPYAAGGTDQQCFDGVYDTLLKRFILTVSSRTVNGAVQYTVWDSTAWAVPTQFTFDTGGAPLSANDVRWIKLAAHPSTNEILMAVSDGDSTGPNIGAAVWNGSSWAQYSTALAANSGGAVGDRPFDVAYAQSSGKGIVAYGKSSVAGRPYYVTYDGSWSGESYANSVGNTNIQRLALAPLAGSDEILMLFNDADGKIGSSRWSGSAWSASSVIESTSSTRESFSAVYRYDQRATQDTTAPGAVTNLTGLVTGDGIVQLTWTSPGDDNYTNPLPCGSRYLFVYSTAAPTDSELTWPATYSTILSTYGASPGYTNQKILSGLPYETTWYFRLRTRDDTGNWSSLSNAATVFVLVTPGMVTDLSASPGLRGRTIDLNWTAPGDDGYIGALVAGAKFAIQRSTWSDVVWSTGSVDAVLISTQNVNPGDRQYYTLTGLSAGDTYYIALWTSDEMGNWSVRSAIVDTYAQPVLLSVTVTPTTYYDFGLLGTAVSSNSATAITVVNTGNVNETYKMRCTNTNNWLSGSSPGYDVFTAHAAYHGSRPTVADFNANDNKLALADKTATTGVFTINASQTAANIDPFVSPSRSCWLRLDMPLATSTSAQQTITVTVTAVETTP